MAIQTVRPNLDYYVLNASRTPAGTPLSNSLDNPSPLTSEYVSFSNGAPTGHGEYIAHMAGESVILGSTKRVRAIQARVDMQNMADPGKNVYVTLLLRDPGTGPNKDTPKDWVSSTVAGSIVNRKGRWNTTGPNGGQWGQVSLNRLTVRVAPYRPPSGTFPRVHGLYLDIDLKDQPTITPLSASATNTTRPTITGTWATTEGDLLSRIRTKVIPTSWVTAGLNVETMHAQWDSGEVATSVPTQTIGRDLIPGVAYTVYMKAAYLVNGIPFWSTWASVAVTLATEPATTPDLSVTLDTALRRVLLGFQGKVNLLPVADDADFEGTAGNYTTGIGITSVARSTVQKRHGVASLVLFFNGTANPFTANDGNSAVGLIPVKAGQQFRMSGYARANSTGRAFRLIMRWYNTTPTYDSQTNGSTATDNSTGWTALPDVTGTAPVDGYLGVQIEMSGTPVNGESHYFDQIQVVPGTTAVAWSPGGLIGTSTASVERWDRSAGLDNMARQELAACQAGFYTRNITSGDSLGPDISTAFVGGYSQRWGISATGSAIDLGWDNDAFDDDYALPAYGGLVAVASFWARASVSGSYQGRIDTADVDGTVVSSGLGTTTLGLTTAWQRFTVAATLTGAAAHAKVVLSNQTGATGQTVWVSGFQWELRAAGSSTAPNEWVPGQGLAPDWQAVRGGLASVMDSSQAFTIADYELPPGIARTYRARVNTILPGLTENLATADTTGSTGAAWLPTTGTWTLKDVYYPDRNAAVRVTGMGESLDPDVAVFHPAGADRAVGFTDFVGGEGNGTITVTALGDAEWAKLRTLLRGGNTLLLDLPEGGHRYLLVQRAQWPRAGPVGRIQRQVAVDVAEVEVPPDVDDLAGFVLEGTSTISPAPPSGGIVTATVEATV